MTQAYDEYTKEDFKVWYLLYDHQIAKLRDAASQEYLEGLRRIHFRSDRIPNFHDTNVFLSELTGWQIHVVAGLIPDDEFFRLMANRRFPASTWLRPLSKIEYLEEPDMFHDVFGHVPLLTQPAFVNYLQALSKIALRYIDDAHAIELISRIYWFTVEFGLIRESGRVRIYGAGILSSPGETVFSLSDEATHVPYDVDTILQTPYRKDEFQKQYFVINSYEQLYQSTPQIESFLNRVGTQPTRDIEA